MIGHWPITRSMCRGSTVAMLSAAIIESVRSPIVRPAGASFRTKTRVTPHRVKLEVIWHTSRWLKPVSTCSSCTTKAGRFRNLDRSEYGKRTRTTSPHLQVVIRFHAGSVPILLERSEPPSCFGCFPTSPAEFRDAEGAFLQVCGPPVLAGSAPPRHAPDSTLRHVDQNTERLEPTTSGGHSIVAGVWAFDNARTEPILAEQAVALTPRIGPHCTAGHAPLARRRMQRTA